MKQDLRHHAGLNPKPSKSELAERRAAGTRRVQRKQNAFRLTRLRSRTYEEQNRLDRSERRRRIKRNERPTEARRRRSSCTTGVQSPSQKRLQAEILLAICQLTIQGLTRRNGGRPTPAEGNGVLPRDGVHDLPELGPGTR